MYNLFYNLNDSPFGLKPDLKYFCLTRTHKRAIMYMHTGFEQPDGILVLTSEKGMGKTTLITYLLEQLKKSQTIVALIQDPPRKDQDFLPAILAALQIAVTEQQPKILFNTLHKFLLEQAELNKKVLLVIDDAEKLSHSCLEFIRLLSTLNLREHGLLQIVLVGTKKLETTLSENENLAFKQQISMSYYLNPLLVTETREYIEHRLKIAGWKGDPLIDDEAFDLIHQLTGGIPSAINQLCDRLLMLGMLCKTHQISKKEVINLTSEAMEKLEKFEVTHKEQEIHYESPETVFEQRLPPKSEPKNAASTHRAVKGIDTKKTTIGTPGKRTMQYLNKKTIFTIVAAYLVSSLSVFVYNKLSENNLFTMTSITKTETKHGSGVETSAVHSESSSRQAKYVLAEIPSDSTDETGLGISATENHLLDIQLLQKKSRKQDSVAVNDQANEGLINEEPSNSSRVSSDLTSQDSPDIASNAD